MPQDDKRSKPPGTGAGASTGEEALVAGPPQSAGLEEPDEHASASGRSGVTAFISWAHSHYLEDPVATKRWHESVFRFAHALRKFGIDVDLDLFHQHDDDVDWSNFGTHGITQSDYVLVVASAAYKRRWEGADDRDGGAGAAREANVLKAEFDKDRVAFRKRVKLVLLPGVAVTDAPTELQSATQRFPIASFDLAGLDDLLRTLTGYPEWLMPEVGTLPPLPPRVVEGLSTDSASRPDPGLLEADERSRAADRRSAAEPGVYHLFSSAGAPGTDRRSVSLRRSSAAIPLRAWSMAVGAGKPIRATLVTTIVAASVTVAIWLLAKDTQPSRHRYGSGNLALRTDAPWEPDRATHFEGLTYTQQIALTRGSVAVQAGRLRAPAGIPAAVPPGLLTLYGGPAETSTAKVGAGRGMRYLWPSVSLELMVDGKRMVRKGQHLSLLMLASDAGELAVACAGAADGSTAKTCGEVDARISVASTRLDYPGPDPKVRALLVRALSLRAAAIAGSRRSLGERRLQSRAAAFRSTAAADWRAAQTLRVTWLPLRDKRPVAALVAALNGEAAEAHQMQAAAHVGDAARFDYLRSKLDPGRLVHAGAVLAAIGFSALVLTRFSPPSAPRVKHAVLVTASTGSNGQATVTQPPSSPSVVPERRPSGPSSSKSRKPSPQVIVSKPE